jgi:hypothetical protein
VDDVYLLLVEGPGDLEQALVAVTLVAKEHPNEHAKGIEA